MPKAAQNTSANAAGISGGTGFAGLVLLMPDGFLRSLLLILAPAITIIITSSWDLLTQEMSQRVVDWRLQRQRKRIVALYQNLVADPNTPEATKQKALEELNAIATLEMQIASRRAKALVS